MKTLAVVLAVVTAVAGAAAYNFDDAVRDMAPNGQGARLAKNLVTIFFNTKFRPDANSKALWDQMGGSFELLSPDKVLQSEFIQPLDKGYKGLGFSGRLAPDMNYDVCLSQTGYDADLPAGLGSFRSLAGVKVNENSAVGGKSYSAFFKMRARSGELSHKNFLALAEGLQKIIAPPNLVALQPLQTRGKSHLNQEAFIVLMQLYQKFPRATMPMKKYINVNQSMMVRENHKGQEYTRLEARADFRLPDIKRDYPGLSEYLDRWMGLVQSKVTIKNAKGHNLVRASFTAQQNFMTLTTLSREGKVVPFDDRLKPIFEEEFSLSQLTDYAFTVDTSVLVDLYGLKMEIEKIHSKGSFKAEPGRASLDVKLDSVSKIKVYGQLAKVVPDWLIDVAIPSNMEDLANNFAKLIVAANNGEGSTMHMDWDLTNPKDVIFQTNAASEIVDSFFLQFAEKVVRYGLKTTGKARQEALNLWDIVIKGLIADLNMYVPPESKPAS